MILSLNDSVYKDIILLFVKYYCKILFHLTFYYVIYSVKIYERFGNQKSM